MSFRSFRIAALLTLSLFTWTSILPPQPANAFFFGGVSLKDEKELGHKFDVGIRSTLPMVEDPEIADYVRNLLARIVKAIPTQPFTFTPGVILHNALNAFAVPGGYVYVFTGLLMNFDSEEAVAGVLCHELAHVTQRHVANRIQRSQMLTLGSLLLGIAGLALGAGGGAMAASFGAAQSAMLSYSRADETEADQVALQYLTKAGYSAIGLVEGFKILRQKSWMNGVNVPSYLSTHPDLSDRINSLSTHIKLSAKSIGHRSNNEKFKRVQMLLWGRYGDSQTALQRFSGKDPLSLTGRAMVLARKNNINEASTLFDEALRLNAGKDALVLREAGIFHYRKGDVTRARSLLTAALARDSHDYMARFFLARLMDDAGQHSRAQSELKDVLLFVPKDAEVHETIARSYGAANNPALAYIHMTYAAMYSRRKELAEKYFEKAKHLSSSAQREFTKLQTSYKEQQEIWKKM